MSPVADSPLRGIRAGGPFARIPERAWLGLRLFAGYRLLLGLALWLHVLTDWGPSLLGQSYVGVFQWATLGYLGLGFVAAALAHVKRPHFDRQVVLAVHVDIVAIAVFLYTSGGLSSGLGTLMIISVAVGSLLLGGRLATLFAASATLAIFADEILALLFAQRQATSFTHAGILGTALFTTSILAHFLALRLRESEAIAQRREIDLAKMETVAEHIVHKLKIGVLVLDDDGRIRIINQAARQLLRLREHSYLGRLIEQVSPTLHGVWRQWCREPSDDTILLPPLNQIQLEFLPLSEQPHRNGTVVFLEDTSERQRQLQQMKLASVGRLTANIAHEIRNPLGAISHASQLLGEASTLDPADQRLLRIIQNHGQRVNTIINEILQLSAGGSPRRRPVDLRVWLGEFAEELEQSLQLERETLSVQTPSASLPVEVDPNHLHQIVTNLCHNAVHHGTAAGHRPAVWLRAGRQGGTGAPFLDVLDRGAGISPEAESQLFEPFFTTRSDGTGLGLYLSKELAQLNDAVLNYFPRPDGGSCFRVLFAKALPTESDPTHE